MYLKRSWTVDSSLTDNLWRRHSDNRAVIVSNLDRSVSHSWVKTAPFDWQFSAAHNGPLGRCYTRHYSNALNHTWRASFKQGEAFGCNPNSHFVFTSYHGVNSTLGRVLRGRCNHTRSIADRDDEVRWFTRQSRAVNANSVVGSHDCRWCYRIDCRS